MLCIAQTLSSETPAGNIQGFLFLHTTHTAELYNSILYILKDMLYTELFGMYTNNIYIQVWHFIVLLLRHSFPIVFLYPTALFRKELLRVIRVFLTEFSLYWQKKGRTVQLCCCREICSHISTAKHFFLSLFVPELKRA